MAKLQAGFSSNRMAELRESFDRYAEGNSLRCEDFEKAMKGCGEAVAQYKLRKIISDVKSEKEGLISFDEFLSLFRELSTKAVGSTYKQAIENRAGVQKVGGDSAASAEGTRHSFSDDEQIGFSDWINSILEDDADLKGNGKVMDIL